MLLEIVFQDVQIAVMFLFFIAIAWLLAEFKAMKDEIKIRIGINNEAMKLQMQALERLTLFADRISLKSMVSRTPYGNMTVVDLQLALLDTIRSEFEYNVSQQVYVSMDMWKAICNLKDQNAYIINQLAAALPSQASGIELSKRLLEYESTNQADISTIVKDALQYEAKKILK
jgi:hypothetical protein